MGRYIIKIWENEHERGLGNSTIIQQDFNYIDNAIAKAKNIMKEYKYASLEVRNSFNEQALYYCTPTEERYFEEYIENAKNQEKVNDYAKVVYGDELYSQEETIYGKLSDVISELRENQEHVNNPKNEVDEETKEFINEETDELVKDLQEHHNLKDFVYLNLHPMSGFFVENDISNLLEELQQEYMLILTEQELTDLNIKTIVVTYYEINKIYNLSEYRDDENKEITPSFSDLYTDLCKYLGIEIESITTEEERPGKYQTTITFPNDNSITITSKSRYKIDDIVQNMKIIRNSYTLEQNQINEDMEMEE